MAKTQQKFDHLKSSLGDYVREGLIIAFSGGIDSAFLLWASSQVINGNSGRIIALTTTSPSVPQKDLQDAREFTERIDVEHLVIPSDEFEKEGYVQNTGLRCYHCKSTLFDIAHRIATEQGFNYIAYGYNASDFGDVRPGHQAAIENNILYPLADSGLTKDEIRELLSNAGFDLAEKPASPCLSSRIMTGVSVTPEKLHDIETLETFLLNHGLHIFRVRLHEEGEQRYVRLEVHPDEMEKVLPVREQFVSMAKELGFRWVTLDLEGYRTGGAVL